MNKQDLITAVAEAADLPKAKAGDVVDAVFEAIQKSLKKKQEVRLVGFGTFSTSKRKAGKGRNPRTGEEIMALFEQLYEQGNTIIVVTHEEDIARHARRIVRLRDGLIESDAPAH